MMHDSWKTWAIIAGSLVSMTLGERAFAETVSSEEIVENKEGIEAAGWKRMTGSKHFFITAELLYWHAYEDGLDYAATINQEAASNGSALVLVENKSKVHELGFHYDPGVRLSIGHFIPHSEWDLYAQWTYYRTHAGDSEEGFGSQSGLSRSYLVPTRATTAQDSTLSSLDKAQGDWSITLHNAILNLGRSFSLNRHFAIRPNFGLMAAWIDQEMNVSYDTQQAGPTVKVKDNNNFFGIGGIGGVDTRWPLASGWSLFGDAAAALLWGHFNLRDHVYRDFNFIRNLKDHVRHLRAYLHLDLGIRYDTYLKNNRYHWGFHFGYEFNEWFGQNVLYKLIAAEENTASGAHLSALVQSPGNLAFQGFSLGARLDF